MKVKTFIILPVLLALASLVNASELKTDKDKLSYIFGVQVGQGLRAEGVELEMDAFTAGIKDMLAGNNSQIDSAQAQILVSDYQEKKQQEMAKVSAKKQNESSTFLANNAKKDGVFVTASGLQYKIVEKGKGKSPTSENKVIAHYTGMLLDGTVFDSSHDRGEPATFPVSGVIKGWQEALPMMKEGGKWQIVVPANLAYGDRGVGNLIGPNETLIFDIELVSISK
jgi:FKBP-type peptidyl-prolyl cis-trans isomerase FklB|tara:strand:- start:65 stop:739 length:675 start_codon:yes stop_codon:yes gene_type:complete